MLLMFIVTVLVIVTFGGIILFQTRSHYREKEELFNRFMAGDYGIYRYHRDAAKIDLKAKEKSLDERDRKKTEIEKELEDAGSQF